MARREFPALGFDPAPGDPAAVTAAAGGRSRGHRVVAACDFEDELPQTDFR